MRNAILKIKIKPTKKLNEIYEMLVEKKIERKKIGNVKKENLKKKKIKMIKRKRKKNYNKNI